MMEKFDASRNRWILADFGANVSPNVSPRLPRNPKMGKQMAVFGETSGETIG